MYSITRIASGCLFGLACSMFASAEAALVVTPTTNADALRTALGGSGMSIDSVSLSAGKAEQVGSYTGFNSGPVTFGNGVILSTGLAANAVGPAVPADLPDDDMGGGATTEFTAYANQKLPDFKNAFDVAALKVDFTLARPSKVSFDSIFGSIEFPASVNSTTAFPDAFFTFLDGTANQISFTPNGDAINARASDVASLATSADTNTAFGAPHALLKPITTTTAVLAAGQHSLLFEVGDANDKNLNSAVFISGLSASAQADPGTNPVPVPPALPLLGSAIAGLLGWARRSGLR